MKNKNSIWIITLILLLASAFRLWNLAGVPPGLSQDEVLNADIVTFIRGGQHALFFREGFGHEPLYHYFAVPFQILLGDNVLSIRLPAIFLGLILIALTWAWVKREWSVNVATITCALMAIHWWSVIFSRVGLRPIMYPVFLLLAFWFWPRNSWATGLFLGLSMYTYTAARIIPLLPLGIIIYALIFQQKRASADSVVRLSSLAQAGAIALTICMIVYAPLGLTLRADPTLQQRVNQLDGPLDALQRGEIAPIWQTTTDTLRFFADKGDPRWTYTVAERPLFDPISILLFWGGVSVALWHLRRDERYVWVLIWLAVGILPSAVTPQAPSSIRMIGAMPAVFLLIALSTGAIYQTYKKRVSRQIFSPEAFLACLFVLVPVQQTIQQGFVTWADTLEVRLNHYQTAWAEIALALRSHPPEQDILIADSFFEPIDHDSVRRNLGQPLTARWVEMGAGQAGALVFTGEPARLYVPEFAVPPATLMRVSGVGERPLTRHPAIPSYAVYAIPPEPEFIPSQTPVTLDGTLTFLGHAIIDARTDKPAQVYSYWRVERPLAWEITAFMHLLNQDGELIAQHDGLDVGNTTLQVGDIILQRHLLPLPESFDSSQPYLLRVGMYEKKENGRRLLTPDNQDGVLLESALTFSSVGAGQSKP